MIECLASVAMGNPLIAPALNDAKLMKNFRQNSLIVAMDTSVLGSAAQLSGNLDALSSSIKSQPHAEGFDETLMPGERGAREYAKRNRDGIPIPGKTWQQVVEVATKYDVAVPNGTQL